MLELKQKQAQAAAAQALASSYELVQHNSTTYIPAHYLTDEVKPLPPLHERIWLPMPRKFKLLLGNVESNILFSSDGELSNFDFMLRQLAQEDTSQPTGVFIRTQEGLRVLTEDGTLVESDGTFLPNVLKPVLNTDPIAAKEVFGVIEGWLNSAEEAHLLLNHLATCLAPGWSAVKYVLLLGDGRNGKSLLLSMLVDLLGRENVSHITRQAMSEERPTVVELNNKLLNVIFDGHMEYLKDSATEKTLVAGETKAIRLLYESSTTEVATNALFVEALNKEPKTRDKSSALQKRLVRFWFPNVYPLDKGFERHMRSPEMLGAFLALLVEHYVRQEDAITKLAPSSAALGLQLDQMWHNSPLLQYISQHVLPTDPNWPTSLIESELEPFVNSFMAWRLNEGYSEYSSADVINMSKDVFDLGWKTKRAGKGTVRVRKVIALKPETAMFVTLYAEQEVEDGTEADAELVDD